MLTDLNPWVVSLPPAAARWRSSGSSVLFLRRHRPPRPAVSRPWSGGHAGLARPSPPPGRCSTSARSSPAPGPHAGDEDAQRNGLDPLQIEPAARRPGVPAARADHRAVSWPCAPPGAAARPAGGAGPARRRAGAGRWSGFVQYFTDLPIVLVGLHMLGAAISAAVTWALLRSVRAASGAVRRRSTAACTPVQARRRQRQTVRPDRLHGPDFSAADAAGRARRRRTAAPGRGSSSGTAASAGSREVLGAPGPAPHPVRLDQEDRRPAPPRRRGRTGRCRRPATAAATWRPWPRCRARSGGRPRAAGATTGSIGTSTFA